MKTIEYIFYYGNGIISFVNDLAWFTKSAICELNGKENEKSERSLLLTLSLEAFVFCELPVKITSSATIMKKKLKLMDLGFIFL